MEQAERELRDEIYNTNNKKSNIKIKRKSLNLNNLDEIPFFTNIAKANNAEHKSILNILTNPEKKTIYDLSQNILNQKKKDFDQEQSSINKYILKKLSQYFDAVQRREAVEEKLKQTLIKSSQLRKQIKQIQINIEKNEEETRNFERKLEDKKRQQQNEILKLNSDMAEIKLKHGKADKERNQIQLQLDEKSHTCLKKQEELKKIKEINTDLRQKIKYLTEVIKYQTQLHTDIQPYKNQTNNEYQEAKGNVRVFCRIRPPLSKELAKKQINIEYRGDNSLIIKGEKKTTYLGRDGVHQDIEQFQFNRIFKQENTQEEVFEEVSPLIQSSLDGFNINIFAYGQTGSGKTFTMEGDLSSPEKYGIVPRAVDRILERWIEYSSVIITS